MIVYYYIVYILLFIALAVMPEKQDGAEEIFFHQLFGCPMANFGLFPRGHSHLLT